MQRLVLILAALLCCCAWGVAQLSGGKRLLDGEAVVASVEAAYEGIQDYTATLGVRVDLEQVKIPPATMTMFFKRPDKVHFDSKSFALLPKQVALLNFAALRERYRVSPEIRKDTLDGHTVDVVTLLPRSAKSRVEKITLTVNPEHWSPENVAVVMEGERMITASIRNAEVSGHWLPSQLVVRFEGKPAEDSGAPPDLPPNARSATPRKGSVTITYSDYRINTGLGDEIFQADSLNASGGK